MYFEFTCMPGERRLGSLLYLCYIFHVLINSLVCSVNNYTGEFVSFSHLELKKDTAMLVSALLMKSRKGLALDIFHAFATHAKLVYCTTDSDWHC